MPAAPDVRPPSVSTTGFADGLGRRSIRFDRSAGATLECLHVRPEIGVFERALRAQSQQVEALDDERLVRVRAFELHDGRLTVISELLAGDRLSDIIDARAAGDSAVSGIDAAFGFLLQILPTLSAMHAASIVHGAIAPGRIILSTSAQVVLADAIYGTALPRLNLSRLRWWTDLGIVVPPSAGAFRADAAGDVSQAALSALMLALGRSVSSPDPVTSLAGLINEVVEIAQIRAGETLATSVRRFFTATLPVGSPKPKLGAEQALAEVRAIANGELGEDTCLTALTDFARYDAPEPVLIPTPRPAARRVIVSLPEQKPASPAPAAPPATTTRETAVPEPAPVLAAPAPQTEKEADPIVEIATATVEAEEPLPVSASFFEDRHVPEEPFTPTPFEPEVSAVTLAGTEIETPVVTPPAAVAPSVVFTPPPAAAFEPPTTFTPPPPVTQPPLVTPPSTFMAAPAFAPSPMFEPAPVFAASPAFEAAPALEPIAASIAPPAPTPIRLRPASVPPRHSVSAALQPATAPLRIKNEPPPGFVPPQRTVLRSFDPEPQTAARPFPWKAAFAAVAILAAGGLGARAYRQRPPASALPLESAVTNRGPATPAVGEPAPAIPTTGTLTIGSEPAGAHVLLDGNDAGQTPLKLDGIEPGRHTVTLVTQSATVKRTVRVEAGKTTAFELPVYSGWVTVFSPVVLEVSEGHRSLGTTEERRILMSPGTHTLTLTHREFGYSTVQTVEVGAGEEKTINVTPTGPVNLNAQPWAEVWIDGVRAGETPLANLQVALGTREFIFKHPQYGERRITATVTTKPQALSVDLTKPALVQ